MIYAASMGGFVKKAIGDKAFHTNVNKIIETLPLDPEVSSMDAVVLNAKDFRGSIGNNLRYAIAHKHENVGVLLVYQKDKEVADISGDIHKFKLAKITPDGIRQAINQVIELKAVANKSKEIVSGDAIHGDKFPTLIDHQRRADAYAEQAATALAEPETDMQSEEEKEEPLPLLTDEELNKALTALDKEPVELVPEEKVETVEDRILAMAQYPDWNFFRNNLEQEALMRNLIHENTQYSGVLNMLEHLDRTITNTFRDPNLPSDVKFQKMKEIGMSHAKHRALQDSIIGEKIISVMDAIMRAAETTIDTRISNIKKSLDTLATTRIVYQDQDKLTAVIEERLQIQTELMSLTKEIIETYKAMDNAVDEFIHRLDKDLTTSNAYIEEILKPVSYVFQPSTTSELVTKVMQDLQSKRLSFSSMEGKLQAMITQVFKLCEIDNSIIEFQQKQIDLLKSHRIEDVIVINSLIKSCMRLFVGPSESGRTATALTWSGVLARRHNTLLIDLSGSSKFEQYGVNAISLTDFLAERIEQPFVTVIGNIDHDVERVPEIMEELNSRLNYYRHINVILNDSQIELMNRFADHSLSVHFVTNCTNRSIQDLKGTVKGLDNDNIARKLVLIDPPVDPMTIFNELELDPLSSRLIVLPRIQQVAAASLKKVAPHENKEVVEVFEEAFR